MNPTSRPWSDIEKARLLALIGTRDLRIVAAAFPDRTYPSVMNAYRRCGPRPNDDIPPTPIDRVSIRKRISQIPMELFARGVLELLDARFEDMRVSA